MSSVNRTTENSISDEAADKMQMLKGETLKMMRNLETGQRIHEVSDEPDSVGSILKDKSSIRALKQYDKNADYAKSTLEISAQRVETLNKTIESAQLSAAKVDNELGKESFDVIEAELNAILKTAFQTSNSDYQGKYLFAGTANNAPPFTATYDGSGNITAVTFVGNTDNAQINISDTSEVSPFPDGSSSTDILAALNSLINLRDAVAAKDPNLVQAENINVIDSGNKAAAIIADIGGKLTRVDAATAENQFRSLQYKRNITRASSQDFAEGAIRLSQLMPALQAAGKVNAQLLRSTMLDHL